MCPPRKAMPLRKQFFRAGPRRILSRLNPLRRLTLFSLPLLPCRMDSKPPSDQTLLEVCLCTYTDRSIQGGKQSTALRARWQEGARMVPPALGRFALHRLIRIQVLLDKVIYLGTPCGDSLPLNGILPCIASSAFT